MESIAGKCVENECSKVCCCCLQAGCFKDISIEYEFSGLKEVYKDMLNENLNVQIHQEPCSDMNQLICENCVSRLRDASAFRHMVLDSQRILMDRKMINLNTEDATSKARIKVEELPPDADFGTNAAEDHDYDDDEILSNIKLELTKTCENNMRKRKNHEHRTKLKKCKIKEESEDVPQNQTLDKKDWSKIVERRGIGPALRENTLKLLANSTICVFQWNKSRYRCFCCKEPFSDLSSLRDHTTKHALEDIEKKIINQQNRLVKVEVSVINCKICTKKLDNLTELRSHLHIEHQVEFVQKEDLLVPFKISGNLQCQICLEQFTVFRLLNIHMNKHYQKQVCHICGSGFSNLVFLNLHKTRSHRPLHCKECDIVFNNKSDKKSHDITVHDVKFERKLRFPCPYCPQRFFQENFRVQHLVEKHGMIKPEHKCVVCSKVFITKSLCNNHVKNVHMKEKNHECDVCHNMFYTKSDVLRHRVTHTGEKKFTCNICNSPFATKDSLRRHMKRTHVGMQ